MKSAIISILLLIFSLSMNAQLIDSIYSFYNFKYSKSLIKNLKVKSITATAIDKKSDDSSRSIYSFNKEGILTEQINYGENGKIETSHQFFVNNYGQKIKEIVQRNYSDRKDSNIYYKTYQEKKLVKDSNSLSPSHHLFEFSKRGTILKAIELSNSAYPRVTKKVRYFEYDRNNRLLHTRDSLLQTDGESYCFSFKTYLYDEKGRLMKEIEKIHLSFPAEENCGEVIYNYDEMGRIESIVVANGMSRYFTYDARGLIVKIVLKMSLKPDRFIDIDTKAVYGEEFSYMFW